MKFYQNITALIVYIVSTPLVLVLGLVKLCLCALSLVYQHLLFPKAYRLVDEWKFIGKFGKLLQYVMNFE